MKPTIKWSLWAAGAAVVLVALGLFARNTALRILLEHRIRSETGIDARISHFSSGIFSPVVNIQGLQLLNPPEFGSQPFIDIPEIHLEFSPGALRRHELHINLMRFTVAEINIVRNAAGQTNLFAIARQARRNSSEPRSTAASPSILSGFQFTGVDTLNLTLGKAKFIDFKDPANDREVSFHVQDQVFRNVKNQADVSAILFLLWFRARGMVGMPREFSGM